MARRKSPTLTDGELRLMRVLWHRHHATVADVLEGLGARPKPAYNTVLTMLRILEQKGYVAREKDGRAHVYRAIIGQQAARRSAVRHLLGLLFDDSPGLLVLNLLEDGPVNKGEMEQLKAMIARREQETR